MRHRTWAYNEISRRYTDKDLQFYTPKTFRTQHKTNRQASNLDEINPVIVPDLADYGHGKKADAAIESHVRRSLVLFNILMREGYVVSKQGWFYRKIFTRNTTARSISIIFLSLLASAVTPGPSGRFKEWQKPVWKLRLYFGLRLWEDIEKMSYHKVKPVFKIGDLVYYIEYGGSTVFSADTIEK